MKKYLSILPLVAALALTGCVNLAPDYERPAAPVEQAWPQGEAYQQSELRREALPEWQAFYRDARLQQVITTALENNRDLRISALNVEKARALYGVQRAELFPTVAATANNAVQRARGGSTAHTYTAQVAMTSYELDFFGRVRNLNEQALQSYLQSEDALRSAQSSLIAQIASTWLTLGADRAQLKLQQEVLASQEESFRLVEESYKYGAASQLDFEQARTTVASARAQIASYIRAVAQDRNALELLVGTKVDDALLPETIALDATLPASLPKGVPSEVLLNRPDVQSAERGMISANANIGVARAAFFPSVTLTAGIGTTGAHHIDSLFSAGTGIWSFTPNVSLPIFTGGANRSNLLAAEASQKIAAATYEKTIQTAFREVADALATEGTVERELAARRDYADAAGKAYELSDSRYKHGAAAFTEVLEMQRAKVAADQQLIVAQLSRAASLVTLYKVLGGGTTVAESKAE